MMNLFLLSTSVCESIPVRRGCVIAYTIVYLPERDIFTIYTGDAHSPAARKKPVARKNPSHAKPVARTQVFFSADLYFNIGQPYDVAPTYYIYIHLIDDIIID